jgi:hypothetical protein
MLTNDFFLKSKIARRAGPSAQVRGLFRLAWLLPHPTDMAESYLVAARPTPYTERLPRIRSLCALF